MQQNFEFLLKINKIIDPIVNIILFFLTSKKGIIALFLIILALIILKIWTKIREQALLHTNTHKKLNFPVVFAVVTNEIMQILAYIFANIATISIIVVVFLTLSLFSLTINTVSNYFENEKKIKELKQVLKNLNQEYKVAKVKIDNVDILRDSTFLTFEYYDYSKSNKTIKSQKIRIAGQDIYFLHLVANFDYSLIETGAKINLAIPVAVFSEKVPQNQAIKLLLTDENGIPLIYKRDSTDLYGVSYETYNERLKEIIKYINNPEEGKKIGIRSQYNAAPHYIKALAKGQIFYIYIQQTGGLVIKPEI